MRRAAGERCPPTARSRACAPGWTPAPDASKSDAMRDPQGGRLEKSRDDSIVPEAEKFQNVSTARKAPEGAGADKAKSN